MTGWLRSIHRSTRHRPIRAGAAALAVAIAGAAVALAQQRPDLSDSPYLRIDPERIMLSDRDSRVPCGECHTSEYEVWRQTAHATGFDTMHRKESAHDILERMGLTVTKRQESLCMRCHYTVGPQLRAIAGVSCESCHGPARDWVDTHNTWGEGVDHPDREAPDHRQQRIEQSVAGGMLRPSGNLYAVAANCFECHTVPIEELVNKGGHSTGSSRFDLVEQADSIRHNFVQEQWGGEAGNRARSADRTRVMFAVGRILAYEYGLRGLANATSEARYFKAMERRVQQTYRELEAVARAADAPAIREILAAGADLRLVPDNGPALLEAADRIRAAGQRFASTADGTTLAALDALASGAAAAAGPDQPQPDPAADATTPTEQPATPGAPPAGAVAGDTGAAASAADPAAPPAATPSTAPSPAQPAAPALPGRVRNRPEWFPPADSRYRTILGDCGECHGDAEEWWYDNTHESTAARLLNREPRAREIATLYGLPINEITRGDRICTSCHGTAPSDAPSAEVLTGVSCERCHGPASEYIEPHEDGGNPQLGMAALKDAAVQAKTCIGCHRITDERLLAASHPSGEEYDIVEANRGIVHWPDRRPDRARQKRGEGPYAGPAEAALRAAFEREAASRPIPRVTVVALPSASPGVAAAAATGEAPRARAQPRLPPEQVRSRGETRSPSLPPRPPATRPARSTSADPARALELEPVPATADSLTSEELLLLVKRRLDRLISLLARGN